MMSVQQGMSGTLGNLTTKQQDKLNKLRHNLEDVLQECHDQHTLLRFLRARRFDLKSSEALFRKDLTWKSNLPSVTSDDIPEVVSKYWPGGCCGVDKEGHPVWIQSIGTIDFKGILHSVKSSDIIQHNILIIDRLYEMMEDQSLKLQKHVEGVIYIADLDHLGLHHLWKPGVDLFNKITSLFEQHYPETLRKIFVINAPKFFPLAFSLVKPFLQEDTRKKVNVLGSNWKDVLLSHIDADVLPIHWGGNATGPDGHPQCRDKIVVGSKVPESYYMKNQDLSRQDLFTYELSRGGCLELKYVVNKPGSVLRYEFKTRHHDLSFGIKRVQQDGSKLDILTKQRYNCHMVAEDGEISLEQPGTYVVKFDNSYSWTKGKTLMYWVELLEPVEDEKEQEFMQAISDDS